jgi:hypothetical protein
MRLFALCGVLGLASRMCEVSGITAPEGSVAKSGVAWMPVADSG